MTILGSKRVSWHSAPSRILALVDWHNLTHDMPWTSLNLTQAMAHVRQVQPESPYFNLCITKIIIIVC